LKSLFAGTEGDVQESIKTEDVQGTEESVTDTDTNLSDFTAMENNTQKAADQIVVPTLDQISAIMDEKLKAFSPAKQEGKTIDPAFNVNVKTKRGDDETKAFAYFVRTGDKGAIKASNDTDMNVGTPADGGDAVPTGHFQGIIARRDESMLAQRLGVRNIPGKGTTVNVPIDNEGDGEFVSTNETANFDRDAPALDQAAMTLSKYTKKIELSVEVLEDEDSRLLEFLNDFVGRGMAKTHNNLLITEVGSNGTSLKTFNSATAVAAGEIEDLMSFGDLPYYLDEGNSNAFIMRPSTLMDIYSIRGAERAYHAQVGDTANTLMGYPVYFSQKTGATNTASSKSVYFGNFNYVGFREAPGFTVLRDPYSKAGSGQVVLHYYFRTVYKVLQAEAVGYGVHPSA
jgi:HK97 family phage major capsid protein